MPEIKRFGFFERLTPSDGNPKGLLVDPRGNKIGEPTKRERQKAWEHLTDISKRFLESNKTSITVSAYPDVFNTPKTIDLKIVQPLSLYFVALALQAVDFKKQSQGNPDVPIFDFKEREEAATKQVAKPAGEGDSITREEGSTVRSSIERVLRVFGPEEVAQRKQNPDDVDNELIFSTADAAYNVFLKFFKIQDTQDSGDRKPSSPPVPVPPDQRVREKVPVH